MKACRKCKVDKPLSEFRVDAHLIGGRMNKCRGCESDWRRANKIARYGSVSAQRRAVYARELELGSVTRMAPQKYGYSALERKQAKLKYAHKYRRARPRRDNEFDDFVMVEAVVLCAIRYVATGIKWSIDHIVPLCHKRASGLHVGINLQVVPRKWNYMKSNKNTTPFWPVNNPATLGVM